MNPSAPTVLARRSSLRRQVALGFGIGAAVIAIMGVVSIRGNLQSQSAARERRAIFERRAMIEDLLSALQDAETGQRGFLLTEDSAFLEPYVAVAGSFGERMAGLRSRLVSDPEGAASLAELQRLTEVKLQELARTITLQESGQRAAALAIVRSGVGKVSMDRVRERAGSMLTHENAQIEVWDTRLRGAGRLSLVTNGLGAILTVIFLAIGFGAVNRNISGRESAEGALRESEQRLVQLIEAMPLAIYVLEANGRPFYANRASQVILGQTLDPALPPGSLAKAYGVYRVGDPELLPAEQLPSARALAGESVYVDDIELRRPDRVVPLEVWATPIRDDAGRIMFAVAVFGDITRRREHEAAIRDLNRQLEARVGELVNVNQELEAFTYSVSHDLRAPVRHMDGFARLLEEMLGPDVDPTVTHYIGRIRDGATNMGHLIDDLLQLSKVSRQDLALQRVDLSALLRSVVYDLRDDTKERDIEWRIERLPSCECDPGLIKVVMTNLVSNALKFSRTRERAVIEVGRTNGGAEPAYFVRDNGVGFDLKYADKLFGVFQRLHRPEDFEGTGVGLATVQRIVHKHGGRVWAESRPEQGATFYFTLRERETGVKVS